MINIANKFYFGQIVYLKTDKEQMPRIVTAIKITPHEIIYELFAGTVCSNHYDIEMSETADILMTT
jgi:hypothetical protein